ncbi:uncharacterized protein LY89DRAFT_787244 [Mollisia scopiformis]|uniref:WW domain-containing protein n=1 Tax=Mollisia scopiformis TaxID=149040 RepID=A0A194WSH2_MOLSC|nr:uncharacterized protein LY89DRAFT_787244 [Mollisia scopiformis]KUJ10913.1 hypothetical protein LY89DRAFT_787244 [Mollisia scopiformis]
MANNSYDLGLLHGNIWRQWADSSGHIFYQNLVTRVMSYEIPAGWEDAAGDLWAIELTKTWPQWNNQRTGRARLTDPNSPPPATYLDDRHVATRISVLTRTPDSPEPLYRRMMSGILQWIFTSNEGFSVLQEDMAANLRPDFTVFKLLARPGGSAYEYDFLLGETKVPGEPWDSYADHLHTVCANNDNDTKNVSPQWRKLLSGDNYFTPEYLRIYPEERFPNPSRTSEQHDIRPQIQKHRHKLPSRDP